MSATEFVMRLTIESAAALPKTDTFSMIDPYIVISVNGQTFQTKVFQDNEEPVWNETFYPLVAAGPKGVGLDGELELVLFDENVMADAKIGSITVPLNTVASSSTGSVTVPWVFTKEKYSKQNRPSTLTFCISGFVQTYKSLRNMYLGAPGIFVDDQNASVYVPVAESGGLVYVGLHCDPTDIDVKVLITQPAAVFVDLALVGRPHTKVIRRTFQQGAQIMPGLVVFEEVMLDDISIGTDFSQVMVMVFNSQRISSTNSDVVVTAHGWKGALSFEKATRTLQNVDIDFAEKVIYMTIDHGETLLQLDYEDDDADIKLAVLATPSTADKGYDLTIRNQNVTKFSEIFNPPKSVLGKFYVSRIYELDDVKYGTNFNDIELHRFHLTSPRQVSVQGITRILG